MTGSRAYGAWLVGFFLSCITGTGWVYIVGVGERWEGECGGHFVWFGWYSLGILVEVFESMCEMGKMRM